MLSFDNRVLSATGNDDVVTGVVSQEMSEKFGNEKKSQNENDYKSATPQIQKERYTLGQSYRGV